VIHPLEVSMSPNRLPLVLALAAVALAGAGPARVSADESAADLAERVTDAREVYRELVHSPDRGVPQELLERCQCVGVFPRVIKAAIGIGGRYGKGVVTCRDTTGWGPLSFFRLTGGSWGLQLGAEATDLVLFFMTERSARSLLQSRFTLGAKAGVAAGPAGRSAEAATDLALEAEIYSYARSKGLFAGLSLEGARLAPSEADNRTFYGESVPTRRLLFEHQSPRRPAEMEALLEELRP
jgi:lipid-binding SYLF domain-containing protein